MPSQVHQEPARFFPLVLVLAALKWNVFEQVHLMWVMPIAFFLGVVVPLVRWGLSRPNNRLTHVPIASNADCSAGVPLRAAREKLQWFHARRKPASILVCCSQHDQ
ncbi:hypothetical protein O0I10_013063 [Lichtheimia ornata]|uniref:Uncharacterized protein n=1 Tax=Lichtheimia ornata TaxID=688661 RepID=A0AAD7UPX8_9FUNG|nr:uncharacterized protein O0I10_013063 [Lichtheimia ornata]KAJ8651399.1 hypothetical protein O0I10_013063 [Lichtheimia ornata]